MRAALILSAMLLVAGCQKSTPVGGGGAGNDAAGGANMPIVTTTPAPVITPAPVVNAPAYLAKTAANDLFAMETSRAVLATTGNADLRRFAETVLHAHEQSAQAVALAAKNAQIALPRPVLPSDRQQQLDGLKSTSGHDADRLYRDDQRSNLVEAVAIHKSYAADGDVMPLRQAAAGIAPVMQEMIDALGHIELD